MKFVEIDDDTLADAHAQLGTDTIDETLTAALELVVELENVGELIEVPSKSTPKQVESEVAE